jgi:hypothetical protein
MQISGSVFSVHVQLQLTLTLLLFIARIHYMIRLNWQSSSVQVYLLLLLGLFFKSAAVHVFGFVILLIDFFVLVCGILRYLSFVESDALCLVIIHRIC